MKHILALRDWLYAGLAAFFWRGPMPAGLRAGLIVTVMKRPAGASPLSRQMRILASAIAAGGAASLAARPETTARTIAALKQRGAAPLLVAGDSHSRLYVQRAVQAGRFLLPLHHLATAASARGLGNASSRSGQGQAIAELLAAAAGTRVDVPVLFVFGQVDMEFVYTFKRLQADPPLPLDDDAFATFAGSTVDAYAAFADTMKPQAHRLALAAIFPPALSDAAWRQGYVNAHIVNAHAAAPLDVLARRLAVAEIADWPTRTAQHQLFNARLQSAAAAHDLEWLDAASGLVGEAGIVEPKYLGQSAGSDHHLDIEAVRTEVTAKLWAFVGAAG